MNALERNMCANGLHPINRKQTVTDTEIETKTDGVSVCVCALERKHVPERATPDKQETAIVTDTKIETKTDGVSVCVCVRNRETCAPAGFH